jgi:hypothetical protein
MEAPTPASALIHSSTLVVAGVFLVIRFSILFEFTTFTNYYLILLGALTLSFGAITATFQNDIKKACSLLNNKSNWLPCVRMRILLLRGSTTLFNHTCSE